MFILHQWCTGIFIIRSLKYQISMQADRKHNDQCSRPLNRVILLVLAARITRARHIFLRYICIYFFPHISCVFDYLGDYAFLLRLKANWKYHVCWIKARSIKSRYPFSTRGIISRITHLCINCAPPFSSVFDYLSDCDALTIERKGENATWIKHHVQLNRVILLALAPPLTSRHVFLHYICIRFFPCTCVFDYLSDYAFFVMIENKL